MWASSHFFLVALLGVKPKAPGERRGLCIAWPLSIGATAASTGAATCWKALIVVLCGGCLVWSMSYIACSVIKVWCDQCPILHIVWSMSDVINVRCDQCPISHTMWSMSGVINVLFYTQCDQCLVWSMSGVINVWCDQCLVWSMSFFTHSVINVCVINVVQSEYCQLAQFLTFKRRNHLATLSLSEM